MIANFAQNDISPLIFFFFWQPVYYLLDPTEQYFPGKSKQMRARWAGIDENIGTKMCWKLVDDANGEIIYRSTIRSTIEPGTVNLQVGPLESIPDHIEHLEDPLPSETNDLLDDFMSLADFNTPFLHTTRLGPVGSIPACIKFRTWQDIERGSEHHEDT